MAEAAGGYLGWRRVAGLSLAGVLTADVVGLLTLASVSDVSSVAATVRTASAHTLAAHTAQIDMTVGFSGGTSSFHSNFTEVVSGVVDFTNHELDLIGTTGPVAGMETREVGGRVYEKLPTSLAASRHLPTPWVSIPAPSASAGMIGAGSMPTGDPGATLGQLEGLSSGTITGATEVGTEDVRGVSTTRYDLSVNLAAMESLGALFGATQGITAPSPHLSGVQIQVWIDDQGLIRRDSFVFDATTSTPVVAGPMTFHSTVTLEPYDFGVPVNVTAPPPDQVTNLPNLGALLNPRPSP